MEGENASFWLPSHFLTDDDHLLNSGFAFGSDPFDSPLSSTDNDDNNPVDDDVSLLSHLTRHFARTNIHDPTHNKTSAPERPWVFSTSPQSTLSGFGSGWSSNNRSGFSSNGSPNGPSRVPSPPLTPELQNDAAWDLLYEAAGQVARLKMNAIAAQLNNRGLLAAPRHSLYNNNNKQWGQERESGWHCRHQERRSCGGALGLPQSAWPPLTTRQPHHHHHHHNNRQTTCGSQVRGVYQGGTGTVVPTMGGVKRQSVGTGVFLPRRVSTSPPRHQPPHHSDYRRKPTVMLPTRASHALNMELEEVNLKSFSTIGPTGFSSDHEKMIAMRNAILGQQRRNLTRPENNKVAVMGQGQGQGQGHEIRLPTDWTY